MKRALIVAGLTAALTIALESTSDASSHAEPTRAQAAARKALDKMLKAPGLKRVVVGASVRALDGTALAAHNSSKVLNPASGTKLLTTAAALHFFGISHRFQTTIVGTIDASGRAVGPLTIVGAGDPKLMPEHVAAMAESLVKQRGLQEVSTIAVDGRIFAGDGVPPAYDQKTTTAGYRASVGAAASHFGAVWLGLKPGRVGAPAVASVSPHVGAVEVLNSVTTTAGPKSSIRTQVSRLPDGRTRMVVSGTLAARKRPWKERRRLTDPNALTGYLLRAALRKRKVRGTKNARVIVLSDSDGPPRGETLVRHESAPMEATLRDVNVWSNNFMAEMVFAHLSRATNPLSPAQWADSQRNVSAVLEHHGLAPETFQVVNGSGLYRATRISAAAMTQLLVRMSRPPTLSKRFSDTLAVSGSSGTLKHRLGGALRGRFVGKTGTLDEVVSLSGYLTTKRGTTLAVALIVNEGTPKRTGAYRAAFDRFLRRLHRRL